VLLVHVLLVQALMVHALLVQALLVQWKIYNQEQDATMTFIRPATPADIPVILHFIRSLALYEREPDAVEATEADLLRDGFGAHPRFECLIAEESREDRDRQPGDAREQPQPVGFALYFYNYSTWRGRAGVHLEDLFVVPEFRGRGIGKELLARVAARAVEQGFDRLRWDVLEWNQPAIDFYRSIGGRFLSEWQIMRLAGEALESMASRTTAGERHI
jgi:GNAT superfamily N-acetyltransferase